MNVQPISANNTYNVYVANSVSASFSLDSAAQTIRIVNSGPNLCFFRLTIGPSSASITDTPIKSGDVEVFSLNGNDTLSLICLSGQSTIYFSNAVIPSFVMQGAQFDFNFAAGQYYPSTAIANLSTTRSSNALAQNADGSWVSFGPNIARITTQGLLVEEARTNLFLNSGAAVTQTITLSATGSYALTCWGTSGSATVAAGTATGTGFGTANASVIGSQVVFNITATGTITVTITGSPLYVQVEAGAFGTSPIITTSSAATRAADVVALTGLPALNSYALFANQPLFVNNGGRSAGLFDPSLTSNNTVELIQNTLNRELFARVGGVIQINSNQPILKPKMILGWDGATYRGCAGGGSVVTGGNTALSYDRLFVGSEAGTGNTFPDTYISRVALFSPIPSDAQLVALTT